MADPKPPAIDYSYTGWQQEQQDFPFPGTNLDNDLLNIRQSLVDTIDALRDVRRADGALQNGVVTPDSLGVELFEPFDERVAQAQAAAGSAAGSAATAATSAGQAMGFRNAAQAAANAAATDRDFIENRLLAYVDDDDISVRVVVATTMVAGETTSPYPGVTLSLAVP